VVDAAKMIQKNGKRYCTTDKDGCKNLNSSRQTTSTKGSNNHGIKSQTKEILLAYIMLPDGPFLKFL